MSSELSKLKLVGYKTMSSIKTYNTPSFFEKNITHHLTNLNPSLLRWGDIADKKTPTKIPCITQHKDPTPTGNESMRHTNTSTNTSGVDSKSYAWKTT